MANGKRLPDLNAAFTASTAVTTPSAPSNAAGVAHGVDVRSKHQRARFRIACVVAANDAAERVGPRRHAGFAHQPVTRSAALRCAGLG